MQRRSLARFLPQLRAAMRSMSIVPRPRGSRHPHRRPHGSPDPTCAAELRQVMKMLDLVVWIVLLQHVFVLAIQLNGRAICTTSMLGFARPCKSATPERNGDSASHSAVPASSAAKQLAFWPAMQLRPQAAETRRHACIASPMSGPFKHHREPDWCSSPLCHDSTLSHFSAFSQARLLMQVTCRLRKDHFHKSSDASHLAKAHVIWVRSSPPSSLCSNGSSMH
ncbi:hypothetical protein L1887_50687 [Cichorium endivia]|nr:hypothetical protein L1887_50687 [Cichorium endivia]